MRTLNFDRGLGNYYGSFEHATMPLSVQVQATQTEKLKGPYGEQEYEVGYPTTVTVAHPGWGNLAYPRASPNLLFPQAIVNPPILDPRKPPAIG